MKKNEKIKIEIINDPDSKLSVGIKIDSSDGILGWKDFPDLYDRFLDGEIMYPDRYTLDIEKMGERLRKKKEIKDDEIICFFMHVIVWGGNSGFRVYRNLISRNLKGKDNLNEKQIHEEVAKSICCAMGFLQKEKVKEEDIKEDIKEAIKRIINQKGLGMSYGSKILRMLSPQHVGVYDSVLADYLLYPADVAGYVNFCGDCKTVVDELKGRKVKKYIKKRGGETWRVEWGVADVEAVLFSYYYKLKKGENKNDI